jgi:hypothetical protein
MVLWGSSERRGVVSLSDRSDTARAGHWLSNWPVGGCDVGGSAARFVEAKHQLWITGTPGALEPRFVAVAAGALQHRPSHGELAAFPSRQRRLEITPGRREGLGQSPGVGGRLGGSRGGVRP